jgi:hypothetical protein
MKCCALLVGTVIFAFSPESHTDSVGSASCGAMTISDQCRISWSLSRTSDSFLSVQQFDPMQATWRTVASLPPSAGSAGTKESPVEGGYLYRALVCDDAEREVNCRGTTMVWAPYVQAEDQVHLIPSRVPLASWELASGRPMYAAISKNSGWLTQVIQYNVYQMANAIARANIADLPDMTPVKDIRKEMRSTPIDQVQFNVFWAYSAEQGKPIDSPALPPETLPVHEHPERHPQ